MAVSVKVIFDEVERSMKRFARAMGVSLKAVYQDQMRLASNQLVRLYPPRTKKKGTLRIRRETGSLFVRLGPKNFVMAKEYQSIGGQPIGHVFETARGATFGVENPFWNLSGNRSRMKAYHKKHRGSNGRSSVAGSWDKRIGRWKFIDRMVVSERAYDNYLKQEVFPKVGLLKKGWIAASAPFTTKAPAWVKKAKGAPGGGKGEYSDQMDLFANGFLQLKNLAPHAAGRDGLVRIVLRTRLRDMKRFAAKRLDKMIARFNAGQV